MLHLLRFLLPALLATSAHAGTVIDIEAPGLATRLMMNDKFARVDNATDGSYLLHDRRLDESYLVLPTTRQVMKLDQDTSLEDGNIKLVPREPSSRRIFGYPTQRYQLYANSQYCGDVFASKQAMRHLAVEPMMEAVATLIDQQLNAMGFYVAIIDNCTQASMRILNHVDQVGMPLRVYDAHGNLLSDIVNIDTDATFKPGMLAYPSEYTLVESVKELSPTQHVLKSVRKSNPELDNAIRSMENLFGGQQHRQSPPASAERYQRRYYP